jgi:hypothetical protein
MVKMFSNFSARLVPFPAETAVFPTSAGCNESVLLLAGPPMINSELPTVKNKYNVKIMAELIFGHSGLRKANRVWQPIMVFLPGVATMARTGLGTT